MPKIKTSAGFSIRFQIRLQSMAGTFAKVTNIIGEQGGDLDEVKIIQKSEDFIIRSVLIHTTGEDHAQKIKTALNKVSGVEILDTTDPTFELHLGGKLSIEGKHIITNTDELSMVYTPGVARICKAIEKNPNLSKTYTMKKNTIAIVTDGSAVLGLGDIGPEAALPVMEGKAILFKQFAGVDAVPICLNTKEPKEIINLVKYLSPSFGGINLEDIAAPRCFEIEKELIQSLDIPVFHDDQHGTAVSMVAAFINALKVVNKKAEDMKIVVSGVGAAGTACTKMLLQLGVKNIIGCDRKGALSKKRPDLNDAKLEYLQITNPTDEAGSLEEVIKGSDAFIGLSGPNVLKAEYLKSMNPAPIVFAMSNPIPEIMPEVAMPQVAVMATGRSDYPNQINNVLCFPGLFRGALDAGATNITESMKMAAAKAIAECVTEEELKANYIIPSVFHPEVSKKVAQSVQLAFTATGNR